MARPRSRRRRVALGGLIVVGPLVAFAALIGVEVVVAGNGVLLVERDPHTIDGHIDPPSGSANASKPSLRVVWLGDSLAAGVGTSSPDGSVARQVARRLDRPLDLEVLAVSGARIGDVLDKQLPLLTGAPDLIFISIGANDVTHQTSLGDFHDRYDTVLSRLPPSSAVIVLGVPDMGSTTRLAQPLRFIAGLRANQLDNVAHDLARAHGSAYVNIAAGTGPKFRADPDSYFAADHYHPSDAGYTVWTDVIVPVVEWRLAALENPGQPVGPEPNESR
jgi:lysophospholipase L1-like esterase